MSDARETLERMIRQREAWLDEKCPHYYDPEPDECICSRQADWSIERDALRSLLAEVERRRAEIDRSHKAILALTGENERLRAKVQRLESRGIEDMQRSIKAGLEIASREYWTEDARLREMVKALKGEKP